MTDWDYLKLGRSRKTFCRLNSDQGHYFISFIFEQMQFAPSKCLKTKEVLLLDLRRRNQFLAKWVVVALKQVKAFSLYLEIQPLWSPQNIHLLIISAFSFLIVLSSYSMLRPEKTPAKSGITFCNQKVPKQLSERSYLANLSGSSTDWDRSWKELIHICTLTGLLFEKVPRRGQSSGASSKASALSTLA